MVLSPMDKRQCVVDAKRCLNCLPLNHFVRDCKGPSKCRKCGPNSRHKHTSALHECFDAENFGAAETSDSKQTQTRKQKTDQIDKRDLVVLKIGSVQKNTILLRTSAKVLNPVTGAAAVVYTQHDTGSQVTLIPTALKEELGLESTPDLLVTICTL